MRNISAQAITDTVARLCIEANTRLPQDVQAALDKARQEEPWPLAKSTLDLLWSNLSAAKEENLPICQDTGMACVFVELGTDVHIDGSFEAAIHESLSVWGMQALVGFPSISTWQVPQAPSLQPSFTEVRFSVSRR